MTLEEYEKLLEEKRKTLQTHKTEERKVDAKQFASMQPLSNKKKGIDDDVFIKLVKSIHILRQCQLSFDVFKANLVANHSCVLISIF